MTKAGESARRTLAQIDRARHLVRQANARRHAEIREWLAALKMASGCVDCGYADSPVALDFDHRDPATKSFQISGNSTRSYAALEAEIAKCDVVCANCHRIRTESHRASGAIVVGRPRLASPAATLFDEAAS